jgi:hypothetical protein
MGANTILANVADLPELQVSSPEHRSSASNCAIPESLVLAGTLVDALVRIASSSR